MRRLVKKLVFAAVASLLAIGTAALLPMPPESRQALFEIPKGTWARRMTGADVEILPSRIELVLGAKDILLLKNMDDVPQIFGPTLIMPGQSLRLPFESASEYQFACSAHSSGQMTVVVEGGVASFWTRLRSRTDSVFRSVSLLVAQEEKT